VYCVCTHRHLLLKHQYALCHATPHFTHTLPCAITGASHTCIGGLAHLPALDPLLDTSPALTAVPGPIRPRSIKRTPPTSAWVTPSAVPPAASLAAAACHLVSSARLSRRRCLTFVCSSLDWPLVPHSVHCAGVRAATCPHQYSAGCTLYCAHARLLYLIPAFDLVVHHFVASPMYLLYKLCILSFLE
jgi:hypothetical protein